MSGIFQRVTARTVGGTPPNGPPGFVLETESRMPVGGNAMSFAALFKLRTRTFTNVLQVFTERLQTGFFTGYAFELFDSVPPSVVTLGVGNGVAHVFAESRAFTALDEGKVHLAVGVALVGTGVTVYLNGVPGTTLALAAYSPAAAPDFTGVMGDANAGGLSDAELIDIAMVDQAFTAAQVAALGTLTRAAGRIPSDFAPWQMMVRAEQLVGHSQVWNLGGLNDGRALLNADNAGPVLSSVLIGPNDWGGSGV